MKLFSCEVVIGDAILAQQAPFFSTLASRFAIITDQKVASLYGQEMVYFLKGFSSKVELFDFPPGEIYKTRQTKEDLENQLFERGFGRDTCIIGLGGGVVTDIAGFLASTFCRGVSYVAIPTSLLGMVDASIGGKTGVNVPHGKNLVGTIYQPKKVLIDPLYLKTLPPHEVVNGCAEMIKHALIADDDYFLFLEKHVDEILDLKSSIIVKAISKSCRIKQSIVEEDEREHSKRRVLSFGHTVGHALEVLTNYSLSHGEAVAIGMMVESEISTQLGFLAEDSLSRLRNLLKSFRFSLKVPRRYSLEMLMQAMAFDKKSKGGMPRFVTLQSIGNAMEHIDNYCIPIPKEILIRSLGRIDLLIMQEVY